MEITRNSPRNGSNETSKNNEEDCSRLGYFSGWTNLGDILSAVKKSGLVVVNHVIWKYQFGVFTERKFVTSHYHVLFLAKTKNYYFNKIMHYPLDVWEINRTYEGTSQECYKTSG